MPAERELCIAIVGRGASRSGWASLLEEEGLPFHTWETPERAQPADLAIVLAIEGDAPVARHTIYANRPPPGASVLCDATADRLHDDELGEISCCFRGTAIQWDGPSSGWFHLARPEDSPRYPIACFDGDATYLVGDVAASLRVRGLTFQPVGLVDDLEVRIVHPPCRREHVVRWLRTILHLALRRAGAPACRLAPTPPGGTLPFVFRIDVDYLRDPGMRSLRRCAADLGWRITAFVNVSGEEAWEDGGPAPPGGRQSLDHLGWLAAFAGEGHEVASHGVRHLLFPDRGAIHDDLVEARSILEGLSGQPVVGHASPGGLWHPAAALAAVEAGLRYTTEASVAWGGQPFSLVPGDGRPALLQVPCSPVYPAFHEFSARGTELFLRFFETFVTESRTSGEMISWMGHPFDLEDTTGELWQGVDELRAAGGFTPTTMREVDAAARQRADVRLRFTRSEGRWLVSSNAAWDLIGASGALLVPGRGRRVDVPASWT